jgi:hypothetical protein
LIRSYPAPFGGEWWCVNDTAKQHGRRSRIRAVRVARESVFQQRFPVVQLKLNRTAVDLIRAFPLGAAFPQKRAWPGQARP